MQLILARCESDRQKMTLAIRYQKLSVNLQPRFNALRENGWTMLYTASNSRALDLAL